MKFREIFNEQLEKSSISFESMPNGLFSCLFSNLLFSSIIFLFEWFISAESLETQSGIELEEIS